MMPKERQRKLKVRRINLFSILKKIEQDGCLKEIILKIKRMTLLNKEIDLRNKRRSLFEKMKSLRMTIRITEE
jgi:hypothetical protein